MKLLAYTSPARGHLFPLVPILTELIARGRQADVCTLSPELDQLTALGIGRRRWMRRSKRWRSKTGASTRYSAQLSR